MFFLSRFIVLWLLLSLGGTTVFSANYVKEFGADWTSAAAYAAQHRAEWQAVFADFGVDARIAEAVVFPELVRYSMWQDEIERAAVSGFYVVGGKDKADFSIGRFQMKPSFAEDIEAEYNRSFLAREFGFIFNVRDDADARRSRVNRLSTEVGQRQRHFHTSMLKTSSTKTYRYCDISAAYFSLL